MSIQGDRGAKGDKGERGEGVGLGTRRAFVALVGLALAVAALSVLFTVNYYHREQGAQQRQSAAEQAAQQRQGEQLEARLCTTLERLAALKPPGGSPAANPARAFDQQQHDVLAQLGPDVGCGEARRP